MYHLPSVVENHQEFEQEQEQLRERDPFWHRVSFTSTGWSPLLAALYEWFSHKAAPIYQEAPYFGATVFDVKSKYHSLRVSIHNQVGQSHRLHVLSKAHYENKGETFVWYKVDPDVKAQLAAKIEQEECGVLESSYVPEAALVLLDKLSDYSGVVESLSYLFCESCSGPSVKKGLMGCPVCDGQTPIKSSVKFSCLPHWILPLGEWNEAVGQLQYHQSDTEDRHTWEKKAQVAKSDFLQTIEGLANWSTDTFCGFNPVSYPWEPEVRMYLLEHYQQPLKEDAWGLNPKSWDALLDAETEGFWASWEAAELQKTMQAKPIDPAEPDKLIKNKAYRV